MRSDLVCCSALCSLVSSVVNRAGAADPKAKVNYDQHVLPILTATVHRLPQAPTSTRAGSTSTRSPSSWRAAAPARSSSPATPTAAGSIG